MESEEIYKQYINDISPQKQNPPGRGSPWPSILQLGMYHYHYSGVYESRYPTAPGPKKENRVRGPSNKVDGEDNDVDGANNDVIGSVNKLTGNANNIRGNRNKISGSGNLVGNSKAPT